LNQMDSDQPRQIVLRNARVVLPDRIDNTVAIHIDNRRITGIALSDREVNPGSLELDLSGLTLFPGFIDVHIHGAAGVDTMEARAEDLTRMGRFLASNGTTSWLPTLVPGPPEDYAQAVVAIEEAASFLETSELRGSQTPAKILGVHYEGPFVSSSRCGALRVEHFRSFAAESDLNSLPVPVGSCSKRMMTVAPEIEGGIELIERLAKSGWIVSIGHTNAGIDTLDQACRAGARHMTHFMNAMSPLHHRAPGPVGWGLLRHDVTCDLIADGIHLDPIILRLLVKLKSSERLILISDAIAAAGMGDGTYKIWGEQISVTNGRTQNLRGSIAGSVISMLDAVNMMRSLGVPEIEVARMAAANPAKLLGIGSDCGSIEEGKSADLVALDDQGQVAMTLIEGEIVFKREDVAVS
jgi:N-acetylglucosamine-6-phosphate deacetylase